MLIWGLCWVLFWGLWAEGCLQKLKDANHDGWLGPGRADGRLNFAICMLFTALEGGQHQLQDTNHDGWLDHGRWPTTPKDTNHDGLLEPGRADGRLKFAIRVLFTTLEGGQQQRKDANHD